MARLVAVAQLNPDLVHSPSTICDARYIVAVVKPRRARRRAGPRPSRDRRSAAVDAAGNVYQALAAGGSVAGQAHAGDKDLVLVKDSPSGTRLWTRQLGTPRLERAYGVAVDPAGDVVVTGYTNGDLDGGHAANTTDDVFVVKFDPAGNRQWLRQFGVAGVADRGYGLATDATGNVYVTGYTRGSLAATNLGDKDVFLAKLGSSGSQLWVQQFGSTGED